MLRNAPIGPISKRRCYACLITYYLHYHQLPASGLLLTNGLLLSNGQLPANGLLLTSVLLLPQNGKPPRPPPNIPAREPLPFLPIMPCICFIIF